MTCQALPEVCGALNNDRDQITNRIRRASFPDSRHSTEGLRAARPLAKSIRLLSEVEALTLSLGHQVTLQIDLSQPAPANFRLKSQSFPAYLVNASSMSIQADQTSVNITVSASAVGDGWLYIASSTDLISIPVTVE